MGLRLSVAAVAAALIWAGAAQASTQELTVTASDGTALACGLVLPDGTPPAGGWPGLLLFHGLGQTHATMEQAAQLAFAPAGFASLACDARGLGASGGTFGLDGPAEVQDARDQFAFLTARPDVSDTAIGAFGISLGGGEVWNAAVAGVPFKAIVPAITWTNLSGALAPAGVPKSGLLTALAAVVPTEKWDPSLVAARDALLGGSVTTAVTALSTARSARPQLASLATPTLLLQGRHDFLFDLDQALAAYELLTGPKRLYLGDLGHPPAPNPAAEIPGYLAEATAWFGTYVAGAAPVLDQPAVELAHDPWDGNTSVSTDLPATRSVSVALPGTTVLTATKRVARGARLTGGPHETFGDGTIVVRYSGASDWPRLVASVSVAGSKTPVTIGAVKITKPDGVATIHLLNEAVLLPRGKKVTVTLGATSPDGSFGLPAPADAAIAIGRVTLKLSLLAKPVSR